MKKLLDWIVRHKIQTALIISGLFIIPLVTIHVLFSFSTQNDFIAAKWSAGDLIGYIAGFYAFVGTVALGALALWQNEQANLETKKANDMSNRLVQLTEQANAMNKRLLDIENSRHSCNIILYRQGKQIQGQEQSTVNLSNECDAFDAATKELFFCIMNHGEAMLKEVKVIFPGGLFFSSAITLAKGEFRNVTMQIPMDLVFTEAITVLFSSCNGLVTYGDFLIEKERNDPKIKHYHFYGLKKEGSLDAQQ